LSVTAVPLRVNAMPPASAICRPVGTIDGVDPRRRCTALYGRAVKCVAGIGTAEFILVRDEQHLLSRAIERQRLVVAVAGEQRRRRAARHVANERAVLRRVTRHDCVPQHLRAVVECVRVDIRKPLFRCRSQVAQHERRTELPASTGSTTTAAASTATATSTTSCRRCRSAVGLTGRCVGFGHVGEPRAVVARHAE